MVWGGHNLASFSTNELFYVNFAEKNKQCLADTKIYKNHYIDPNYKIFTIRRCAKWKVWSYFD